MARHESDEAQALERAAVDPASTPALAEAAAAPVAPIPLLTPVPLSPPFAALDLAAGSIATPGAQALAAPPPLARESTLEPRSTAAPPRPTSPLAGDLPAPDDETCYTGEALRRAREARGITLAQLCERTKILRSHMENVEAGRYERLPPPVYLRGILMALAKELRLDGHRVARSYLEMAADAASPRRKV